mgnify:CR=1 FL=1
MHVLVIPKKHITSLATATADDTPVLGRMLATANEIASAQGSPDGFRIIINTGRVGQQEVPHLHIHIVPRWFGDTNFMPVIAHNGVIPQALVELGNQLRTALAR